MSEKPEIPSQCPSGEIHDSHAWAKEWPSTDPGQTWFLCPGVWSDQAHPMCMMKDEIHLPHRWVDAEGIVRFCEGVADNDIEIRENRALPVRWADRAMFKAEPIDPDAGPKVYCLDMTRDPLGHIAATCKMYKGEVVQNPAQITDEERLHYLSEMTKTKLTAPLEFVQFHFMIEGVTRAFTHQLVRQRTAAYAQESLRFAVVAGSDQDMPVALPPSLSGTSGGQPRGAEDSTAEWQRNVWDDAIAHIQQAYSHLVESGIPAEDARGLLPHNILTRVHYTTNLRSLLDHAGNRLCTQAQFEWRLVFSKIIESIRRRHVPAGTPQEEWGEFGVYMAEELLAMFKPVCFQTGRCEFKAAFDRACSIRSRVDAFAAQGVPTSEWHKGNGLSGAEHIPGIHPAEWLMNPSAARER